MIAENRRYMSDANPATTHSLELGPWVEVLITICDTYINLRIISGYDYNPAYVHDYDD